MHAYISIIWYTGTHLIQDVTVALTSQPSEISVCCTFVTTSLKPTPSRFLVVVYSTSENIPRLHYGIATRSSKDAVNAEVIIPRLYEYEYRVSVFALNEDGLPSNRSVAIAQTISNVTNREGIYALYLVMSRMFIVAKLQIALILKAA